MHMTRTEAITRLGHYADALRARGATALYLFGSAARNEAGRASDLDVFLDYDPTMNFSLVDLVDIKQFLEGELAVEVDVTTRDSLHPSLRDEIERSAVRVF
jgi:predicted nucleotidyltransferase